MGNTPNTTSLFGAEPTLKDVPITPTDRMRLSLLLSAACVLFLGMVGHAHAQSSVEESLASRSRGGSSSLSNLPAGTERLDDGSVDVGVAARPETPYDGEDNDNEENGAGSRAVSTSAAAAVLVLGAMAVHRA